MFGKIHFTLDKILYLTIFVWSLSDLFAYSTNFGSFFAFKVVAVASRILVRLVCVLYILLKKNRTNLSKPLIIILLAEITNYYAKTNFLVVLLYLLAAGKTIDENKVIKALLYSNIIIFLVTSLCAIVGLLPNLLYIPRLGYSRYTLGFLTANTGPIVLFQITTALWVLNRKQFRCFVVAIITFIISYFVCYSRSAALLSLVLIFAECIWWLTVNQKSKIFKSFIWKTIHEMAWLVLILSIGTFIVASQSVELLSYNEIFSGRIVAMQKYFSFYTPQLFGQKLAIGEEAFVLYGLSTLDNSYIHLFLAYGVVLFGLFLLYFKRVIVYLKKHKLTKELIIVILYAIYGFTEIVEIRFVYNFSLVYINKVLWKKSVINADG